MLGPVKPACSRWSTIIGLPAKEVSMTPNIADIIRHHVALEVRCIDRLYLHAYMPKLQTSGGLCYFLHDYLGHPGPVAGAAQTTTRSLRRRRPCSLPNATAFRSCHLSAARVRMRVSRNTATDSPPARASSSSASRRRRCGPSKPTSGQGRGHTPVFDFSRQSVAVNHYYFYVQDRDWGPAFLKIGTYLPVPGEALSQRPRVGEATAPPRSHPLREPRQRLPLLCRPDRAPGRLRCARSGRRAGLLRPLVASAAVADDHRGTRGRLRPSARHLPTRSQSDPGLRSSGAGPTLLRGGDPRESRSGTARPRALAVSAAPHARHATTGLWLSDARHHGWRPAEPARRVQVVTREAVLQRAARPTHRNHHQQPDGLLRPQRRSTILPYLRELGTRSIASCSKSNASVTTAS